MGNLVKYGEWSADEAEKEKEDLAKSGTGAEFMKLAVGRNVVRVLPPALGKKTPFKVFYQHFINVPGQTNAVSFACPRMEAKRYCPACEKADALRATGNPADYDLAGQLFAKRRVFVNVIDRKNPESGPKILAFGKTVHEQMLALRTDEDAGGDYTHPANGFDLVIEREGTGKNDTSYKVFPARKQSALGNDEWIMMQHNLDAYARVPSQEELERMIKGQPSGSSGTRPAAGGGGRPAGGKRRTAADDAIDTTGEEVDDE